MKNRDRLDPPKIKWLIAPTFDEDGVQRTAGLDELGREHGDPVPMDPDVGLTTGTGDTLHQTLRQLVRDELFRRAVEDEGFESFEESDDFDVEDDIFPVDPQTPYEAVFDPPPQGDGGRSPTLASEAPNGGNRAPEEATRQPPPIPSDQKASEGLDVELKAEPKVEKPSAGSPALGSGKAGSKPSRRAGTVR